jgi:hypothetical protein
VTTYPRTGLATLAEAAKLTIAWAFPATAVTAVGGFGGGLGVMLFDATDAGPVPTALVAVTVNVYAVPLVRPGTTIDVHGAVQLADTLPGLDVAV